MGEVIERVTETRITGLITHALIASSIFLLPLLSNIPIPVVSGVFLFLERKLMSGNTFFQRICGTRFGRGGACRWDGTKLGITRDCRCCVSGDCGSSSGTLPWLFFSERDRAVYVH